METGSKFRGVFTSDNQVALAPFGNVNRIDTAKKFRRILTDPIFVGTVQRTQRPCCVA